MIMCHYGPQGRENILCPASKILRGVVDVTHLFLLNVFFFYLGLSHLVKVQQVHSSCQRDLSHIVDASTEYCGNKTSQICCLIGLEENMPRNIHRNLGSISILQCLLLIFQCSDWCSETLPLKCIHS